MHHLGSMRISVIVPAFNEERLLGETLRQISQALGAFARRQWETELIVCDNMMDEDEPSCRKSDSFNGSRPLVDAASP